MATDAITKTVKPIADAMFLLCESSKSGTLSAAKKAAVYEAMSELLCADSESSKGMREAAKEALSLIEAALNGKRTSVQTTPKQPGAKKAAPVKANEQAEGQETLYPQAAWPFPTSSKPKRKAT